MTEPLHQSNWIYGISDNPMATSYTTDLSTDAPGSLIKFVTTEAQAAQVEVATINDEGQATGTDWATRQETVTHDVNIPFSIDPTVQMLGRLLYAALGGVTTTTPATATLARLHTFVPQDANLSRQLPPYWITEKCGTGHDALYPGCTLEKATFKGENFGWLNVAGNFRGSGQQYLGEDKTINAETGKYFFKNTQSVITRATSATPGTVLETFNCGLKSWMVDIDNAHSQQTGYEEGCGRFFNPADPDSGIVRSHHLFGRRKYTAQFTIWLADSSTALGLLRAQSPISLKPKMTGAIIEAALPYYLQFHLTLGYYRAVEIGNKDGFVTMQISVDAFFNETANSILSVELQNKEVSYTT